MIQKIIIGVVGVVASLALLALLLQFKADTSKPFGVPAFERVKWIGEVLTVGSSEQFSVDSTGTVELDGTTDASTGIATGSITVAGVTQTTSLDATLQTATTTVCALQSPAATTTLVAGWADFTTSSTTATTVTLAKAANAFATTTVLGIAPIAANAQGTVTATSTPALGMSILVFGPSQWFVVGMAGAGAQTYSPAGSCGAVFRSVI